MENLPFEKFIDFLLSFSIWDLVKGVFCFTSLLYIFFSLVVVRQVGLMLKTLEVQFEWPIRILSWLNLFLAVFVFIASLLVL